MIDFTLLQQKLHATWHPDEFQGWGKTRSYFEGWYFKIVSADERHAFAFIPGIAFDPDGKAHAFIQVMNGKKHRADYHTFDVSQFQPSKTAFDLKLADNHFSANGIQLDLPGVKGSLKFEQTTPWPKMLGAPGIMGWYSFVPFMECFHGIVSMFHYLSGTLIIDGESVNFTGGKGFVEKDWGRSFPKAYLWMQSNHFDKAERASMMASVAHIPWLGHYFIGFISGFWLDGRLFKFATYNGSKQYVALGDETISIVFKNAKTELRIWARQTPGVALVSPLSGAMTGKVQESLEAILEVELLENDRRIYEGAGRNAGLEAAGDLNILL